MSATSASELREGSPRAGRLTGNRPGIRVIAGLLAGFLGLALLIDPAGWNTSAAIDPTRAAALILGTLCWSSGSIYARSAALPSSAILTAAMQQVSGGALLLATGILTREPQQFQLAAITPRSWMSFLYLSTIGSLVAYTAYVWLLQATSPAKVATYAYVNPVVAVFLGWALNGERLTRQTLLAAAVIIAAVALIILDGIRRSARSARTARQELLQK